MTYDEVIEKFGSVILKFDSYYKYVFTYVGSFEDYQIVVKYGGNADDIYRHEVSVNSTETFYTLWPNGIEIYKGQGNQIFSWYNW